MSLRLLWCLDDRRVTRWQFRTLDCVPETTKVIIVFVVAGLSGSDIHLLAVFLVFMYTCITQQSRLEGY